MQRFVIRALIAAIGLWLADELIGGIGFASSGWLIVAAFVLGVINAFVRPIAVILTLPITLVTLGLFLLVLNAAMLALAAWLLPGFAVQGFGAAFLGALVVSAVSWVGSWFVK
jgi:putative membrane protein